MDKCGEYGLTEFPTQAMVEPDNLALHKALIMGCNRGGGEQGGGSPDHREI